MRPIVAWKISIHHAAFFEVRKRDVGWKLVYRQCVPDCGHVAELVKVDRLLNIAVDSEGIPANYVGLFVRTGAARLPGESVCGIGLQLQCCTPMPTYQS